MLMMMMMPRGEEREREEEEVVYNDQPESDQHFNLPRIQVIIMIMIMMMLLMIMMLLMMMNEQNNGMQVNGHPDSLLDLTRLSQVSDFITVTIQTMMFLQLSS